MKSYNKKSSKFRLDQRKALVTGLTLGIGWEIAKGMPEAGASVYINGMVKDVLDSRCQELCDLGYDANAAHIDNQEVKQFVENRIPNKKCGGNQKKLRALQYS